ncbi:MAG: hypothetical protein KDA25_04200 [Phycisphaerales bacterium]|nr:hypothetical protein [Phycisphaerales bacterium]
MSSMVNRGLVVLLVGAVFLLAGCGGCKTKIKPYNIAVTLGPSLYDEQAGGWPSVEVDIVSVKDPQLAAWQQMPIRDYFNGDPLREDGNPYRMTFPNNAPRTPAPTRSITAGDAHWNDALWKDAEWLVIIAWIPNYSGSAAGDDPRRQVLPRDWCEWKTQQLDIRVDRTGINVLTPKAPKQN